MKTPIGNRKFRVGQRVRPSKYAKEHCAFPKTRHEQSGVVTRVDEFGFPSVLWDGRRGAKSYWPGFVSPDRRASTLRQGEL